MAQASGAAPAAVADWTDGLWSVSAWVEDAGRPANAPTSSSPHVGAVRARVRALGGDPERVAVDDAEAGVFLMPLPSSIAAELLAEGAVEWAWSWCQSAGDDPEHRVEGAPVWFEAELP